MITLKLSLEILVLVVPYISSLLEHEELEEVPECLLVSLCIEVNI
nr:MAG TPA: hypothetical protein [Caudoviricetes sp.]